MGINFGTSATVFNKSHTPNFKGKFCCLRYFETDKNGTPTVFPPKNERLSEASAKDFGKIPGSPIAYWVSKKEMELYSTGQLLGEVSYPRKGLDTGENDQFLRLWHEVALETACLDNKDHHRRWFPYNKGGDFRRWYGNREYLINWERDGEEIKARLNWKSKSPLFETLISIFVMATLGPRFHLEAFQPDIALKERYSTTEAAQYSLTQI